MNRASYSDKWLYRAKCLRCHDDRELRRAKYTAVEWEQIVERVSRRQVYAFRTEWKRQINRYLRENLAVEPPPEGTPERERRETKISFEMRCGVCHSLDILVRPRTFEETDAEMVERMRLKAPSLISYDEVRRLTDFVGAVPQDLEKFQEMFPHDRKLEISW
ncbi:MAG: hypothetical protein M5R36_04385 [Deltaproteobacteria bacterium]|nr:hypothetical protein [Deltaproteobacteria bacterium]